MMVPREKKDGNSEDFPKKKERKNVADKKYNQAPAW